MSFSEMTLANANDKTPVAAKFKIKWILAHEPAKVFLRAANEFAKQIAQRSNGEILVTVVDPKEYGGGTKPVSAEAAFKLVQSGEIQMSQTYTTFLGQYDKQMWILDLPYLFKDHQHAAKVLDGQVGQNILAGLDSAKVHGLAFTYSGGYRIISSSQAPLDSVESFKGKEIGVTSYGPIAAAYMKELGAKPYNINSTTGQGDSGDGFESTYARLSNIKNLKAKYLNETEHTLFLTSIIINKELFDGLPEKYKTLIHETAISVANLEREESLKDNELSKKYFIEKNKMTLVKMNEKEINKMKELSRPVYKAFETILNQKYITQIQELSGR